MQLISLLPAAPGKYCPKSDWARISDYLSWRVLGIEGHYWRLKCFIFLFVPLPLGSINFFILWPMFRILLWPVAYLMITALSFFSTTLYGSGANVDDSLFSQFWRNRTMSSSLMSLVNVCLFLSAYSFSLSFLRTYLSCSSTCTWLCMHDQ